MHHYLNNIYHLNYDNVDTTFTTMAVDYGDDEPKGEKVSVLTIEPKFNEDDGLFSFPINDTKTKKVTDFYKETPFPNYKDDETKQSIVDKGNKNLLAQQFKKFIGHNKNVLEVGCGTGQLSIYFAIGTNNEIIAFDPTIESLNLAKNFSKQKI